MNNVGRGSRNQQNFRGRGQAFTRRGGNGWDQRSGQKRRFDDDLSEKFDNTVHIPHENTEHRQAGSDFTARGNHWQYRGRGRGQGFEQRPGHQPGIQTSTYAASQHNYSRPHSGYPSHQSQRGYHSSGNDNSSFGRGRGGKQGNYNAPSQTTSGSRSNNSHYRGNGSQSYPDRRSQGPVNQFQRAGTGDFDFQVVHLSKTVSYLLRHGAKEAGLKMRSDGFVLVRELLRCRNLHGKYTVEDIRALVANDNKQRFMLKVDETSKQLMIRANQGHTIEVNNLDLQPIVDPKEVPAVIHGTFLDVLPLIKTEGLSRMSRNHIHFAVGKPGANGVISGMRSECQVLIHINLKKALEDGLKFFRSANNVILSPGDESGLIHPKYFEKIEFKMTGKGHSSSTSYRPPSSSSCYQSSANEPFGPKRRK